MGNLAEQEDEEAIRKLLAQYFDGLFYCDSKRLQETLHPSALYATAVGSVLRTLTMDEYWPIVDSRISPAEKNEPRFDKILAIDLLGETMALAKVECAISSNFYNDFLTLIKLEKRWWIVAKVFTIKELSP